MNTPRLSLQCDLLSPMAYLPSELQERVFGVLADRAGTPERPSLPLAARFTLQALTELIDPHANALAPVPLEEIQRYARTVLGAELTPRSIKASVKLLVEEYGIAIGSARGARHGYFFVTTDEEAVEAAKPLLAEIRSLARRCRTLSPRNPYIQHLLGQTEVGLGS